MLKYRHTSPENLPQLDQWVAEDSVHKDQFTGSHFILPEEKAPKGVQCIEISDEQGILFYLKLTNAVLVEAQFPPKDEVTPERIRRGLREAFGFFSHRLREMGYHAMLFDSVSKSLIRFFEGFGFKRIPDFFRVSLDKKE